VATSYKARRLHLGYRVATLLADGVLGPAGTRLVGHEFHYASERSAAPTDETGLAAVTDAEGVPLGLAGHRRGQTTGSFFHLIG
jgi:cobyrinic acid a,c-diamide synthase